MAMTMRERKRRAARAALNDAALRLGMERGWDNVRVEDIAAEVGISTRSFSNYFASKEEALCAVAVDRPSQVRQALAARPAEEPLWDSVIAATLESFDAGGEPDRALIGCARLVSTSPRLRGEYLRSQETLEHALAEGIAARSETDAHRDLYPRLMAGVVVNTLRIAIDHWLTAQPGTEFAPTLRRALEEVALGMPDSTAFARSKTGSDG